MCVLEEWYMLKSLGECCRTHVLDCRCVDDVVLYKLHVINLVMVLGLLTSMSLSMS